MKTKQNKTKEFVHISNILQDSLKSFRRESDIELIKIWDIWNNAVGTAISENAQPAAFKGTKLIVHVSSSPWMQQLQFLKKDIIYKLNQTLGNKLVNDIKFKIGPLK